MPYRPQLPAALASVGDHPGPSVGSPIREKPVTSVTEVTQLLQNVRARLERDRLPIAVRVSPLEEQLWFVPGEIEAEQLIEKGVGRGRIWTAAEIDNLLRDARLSGEDIVTLARIKLQFDGDLVSVDPWSKREGEEPVVTVRKSVVRDGQREHGREMKAQQSLGLGPVTDKWCE